MRRRSSTGAMLLLVSVSASISAQVPGKRLAFEIASVKPNRTGNVGQSMQELPGGRLIMTNFTLRSIVRGAYDLTDAQLTGGPSWIDTERWDIAASAGETMRPGELNPRLRSLLEDRFHLNAHREVRQMSELALVVRDDKKRGTHLERASPADTTCERGRASPAAPLFGERGPGVNPCGSLMLKGHLWLRGVTMGRLASGLAGISGNPLVVDRTELSGAFNAELEWSEDPNEGASIYTALQEQLGLRLQSINGPVDVLVIDHVERPAED